MTRLLYGIFAIENTPITVAGSQATLTVGTGDRASVVAQKRGMAHGAKGGRKVEAIGANSGDPEKAEAAYEAEAAIEVRVASVNFSFEGEIEPDCESISSPEKVRRRPEGQVSAEAIGVVVIGADRILGIEFLTLKQFAVIIIGA